MREFILLESPFAGDVEANKKYAAEAVRDSLRRGEAPFASHLFYTQFLDDDIPAERSLGIERAHKEGRPIEYRSLDKNAA